MFILFFENLFETRGKEVVEALCYKPEGREFEIR
jgi:hypothetical protein